MIRAPRMIVWLISRMPESNDVAEQRAAERDRSSGKTHDERGAEEGAADAGEAADDDDEQDLERAVEVEARGSTVRR